MKKSSRMPPRKPPAKAKRGTCPTCMGVLVGMVGTLTGIFAAALIYSIFFKEALEPTKDIWDNRSNVYQVELEKGSKRTGELIFRTPLRGCTVHRFNWMNNYYILTEGSGCHLIKE